MGSFVSYTNVLKVLKEQDNRVFKCAAAQRFLLAERPLSFSMQLLINVSLIPYFC